MTARPRKASDEQIYQAAQRVMGRLGPTQWTLADVAAEAGLTAGALVQRFGSKRDLQLSMMRGLDQFAAETFARLRAEHASPLAALYGYADCLAVMGESPKGLAHHLAYLQLDQFAAETFARLRAEHASPLAALYGYADCLAVMGESPKGLAHHLAYLQLDLTDPDFHRLLAAYARATRAELRRLIEEGIERGELAPTDPEALARVVEVTLSGSLMTWGIYQEGTAVEWLREDLRAVLRPHSPVGDGDPAAD